MSGTEENDCSEGLADLKELYPQLPTLLAIDYHPMNFSSQKMFSEPHCTKLNFL